MKYLLFVLLVTGVIFGEVQGQNPVRGFFSNIVANIGRVASRLAVVTSTVKEMSYVTVTVTVTTTPVLVQAPPTTDLNSPNENVLDTTIQSSEDTTTTTELSSQLDPAVIDSMIVNGQSNQSTLATTAPKPTTTLKLSVVSGSRFFSIRRPKDEEESSTASLLDHLEASKVLT